MNLQNQIDEFLNGSPHAVVGASKDRSKYGNKVLRAYLQNKLPVYAVNPNAKHVENLQSYPDLESLPETVHGISIITPSNVTETIVQQAVELEIRNIWMQPGSENDSALALANESGMNVIFGGPCALVVLGYRET